MVNGRRSDSRSVKQKQAQAVLNRAASTFFAACRWMTNVADHLMTND